jgi:hypothetical protein
MMRSQFVETKSLRLLEFPLCIVEPSLKTHAQREEHRLRVFENRVLR